MSRGLIEWIGDWLGIGHYVTVTGSPSRWELRRILRTYGVNVKRISFEREKGAPWWARWRRQANILVSRYEDVIAAEILRDHGFEVSYPFQGASYGPIPSPYRMRVAMIEQRYRMAQGGMGTGMGHLPPWMRFSQPRLGAGMRGGWRVGPWDRPFG